MTHSSEKINHVHFGHSEPPFSVIPQANMSALPSRYLDLTGTMSGISIIQASKATLSSKS